MTTSLHSKRVVCSIYSIRLNFTERNSNKDLTLQRKVVVDVCKIDVLKDFAKLPRKRLCQILCLMKLQASSLQLYCKRDPDANEFCRIFKNTFLIELFWETTSDSSSTLSRQKRV